MIHRYFWPDTPPYAIMLRHIAGQLSKDGHDITILSTQPSYKPTYQIELQPWEEQMDGFTVKRLKIPRENRGNTLSRIYSMLSFSVKIFFQLCREKPDLISIATTPQIIGGLIVRLASKVTSSKYIYHCQDIYPEVAHVSGHLRKGLIFKLLKAIDKKTCDNAFATVVLSDDMKNSILSRGCQGNNIRILNNFELTSFNETLTENRREKPSNDIPTHMARKPDVFRIIFAGNIGKFQGLDVIIKAAKHLVNENQIEFVFLGEGRAKSDLELQSAELLNKTVKFFGHQKLNTARQIIADSQLCIVSLSEGIYRYAYPSKTMTYMCESRPVIVIAEVESQLSETIRDEQLGITITPGDDMALAEQIKKLYYDKAAMEQITKNTQIYANNHFRVESVLPRWSELIKEELL